MNGRKDIEEAFRDHSTVYVHAKDEAIETAIHLAEHFVQTTSK